MHAKKIYVQLCFIALLLPSSNALVKTEASDCFMCSLPKPTLPPITSAPAGINFTALREVFDHSFSLSRTIYEPNNRYKRPADYWFKQVQLPGQAADDILFQLVTGDITSMWVRDSVWQVIPYVLEAKQDPLSALPCDVAKPSLKCISRGVLLTLAFLSQQRSVTGVVGNETDRPLMPSGYFSVFHVADRTGAIPLNVTASNSWPKPTFRVTNPKGVRLAGFTIPFGAVLQQHGYPGDPAHFKASNSAEGSLYSWKTDLTPLKDTTEFSYVDDIMYEPDGLSSLTRAVLLYHNEYPEDGLLDHPWIQGVFEAFVGIIATEINHDNSPYSVISPLYRLGVPSDWPSPVKTFSMDDDAVLTWIAFRPSDEPCKYNYNIPVNLYIATALDSIGQMYPQTAWAQTAATLAKKIVAGVHKYGVVGGKYAYEVDALGNQFFADDANYPNLQSLPFMVKPDFFDLASYKETAAYLRTSCSAEHCDELVATQFCDAARTKCLAPYYHSSKYCEHQTQSSSVLFEGLASSTQSTKNEVRIWPMSTVIGGILAAMANDTAGFWTSVEQISELYSILKQKSSDRPLSLPESFLACNPAQSPSRDNDSFGWMGATLYLLGRGWWQPDIPAF